MPGDRHFLCDKRYRIEFSWLAVAYIIITLFSLIDLSPFPAFCLHLRATMKNVCLSLVMLVFLASCSSTSKNIFSKKTPHEKYAEKLDDHDLEKTPAGRQWLAASKAAL